MDMLRSNGKSLGNHVVGPEEEEKGCSSDLSAMDIGIMPAVSVCLFPSVTFLFLFKTDSTGSPQTVYRYF